MITIVIKEDAEKTIELDPKAYRDKDGLLYRSVIEAIEKPLLEHILDRTDGNQLKAAKILGINRNTMRAKIKKLAIDVTKWKG
jgi:two-component system nitrogen regulation response regulator GlnG